jgi:hypothetical protein
MAVGQWEPWGDAIWLGNNWMTWRPEAYKIVVLATDEPCDEGRRVPGPLGRTTGTDYDSSALWNQVSLAASKDITYITIDSGVDLTTTQLEKVAQWTGGLYYNFSHAQAEQFVSVINDTIAEVVKGEQRATAGYNVIITDLVSSEVEIQTGSFNIPPTSQTTNPNGSVTLTWNLGDLKYNEAAAITYQIRMLRCGNVQTNLDADVDYLDWEGKPASIQLPLPVVTVPCPSIESVDSDGIQTDVFNLSETMYVVGNGYSPLKNYVLHIVEDVNSWMDEMVIPSRVLGTVTTVSSNSLGNIMVIAGWDPTLNLGKFDIVVDVDNNGIYNMRVDALDDNDVDDTAGFTVIPAPEPPIASFSESTHVAPVDVLIDFNASSSYDPDGEIVLYEWDFDGDGIYDTTGITSSYAYLEPGNYTVTLRVTDNDGLTDKVSDLKVIVPPGVIPEVPLGTIMTSAAMIIAFFTYVTLVRKKIPEIKT